MAEMPAEFTEVGKEVAVLPYNAQTASVKLAKITKVTKTQVTVEYPHPNTTGTMTTRFHLRKHGRAYGEDPAFPRLNEYGAEYRALQLALVTDPAIPRMVAARKAFIRDKKLRDVMSDVAKRTTVAGARELIDLLTEWVAAKEAEDQ